MGDDKEYSKDFIKQEFLPSNELMESLEMYTSKSNDTDKIHEAIHNLLIHIKDFKALDNKYEK